MINIKIDYKITDYFEEKNLFENTASEGLKVKIESKTLLITGDSRDLTEFADLLVNVAKNKEENHIHIDNLTLLDKTSDVNEIIIEKEN